MMLQNITFLRNDAGVIYIKEGDRIVGNFNNVQGGLTVVPDPSHSELIVISTYNFRYVFNFNQVKSINGYNAPNSRDSTVEAITNRIFSNILSDYNTQTSIQPAVVNLPELVPVIELPAMEPVFNIMAAPATVNVASAAPVINVAPSAASVSVSSTAPVVNVATVAPVVNLPALQPVINLPAPIVNNTQVKLSNKHARMATASSNTTLVKSGACQCGLIMVINNGLSDCYIKIYDKATAPDPATDTPVQVYLIKSGATLLLNMQNNLLDFSSGMGYVLSTGFSLLGVVNVSVNTVLVNISTT